MQIKRIYIGWCNTFWQLSVMIPVHFAPVTHCVLGNPKFNQSFLVSVPLSFALWNNPYNNQDYSKTKECWGKTWLDFLHNFSYIFQKLGRNKYPLLSFLQNPTFTNFHGAMALIITEKDKSLLFISFYKFNHF